MFPACDQEFRVRCSNLESLHVGLLAQFIFASQASSQDSVNQGTMPLLPQLHSFVNGRVFRGFEDKELIQAESKDVVNIGLHARGAQTSDPEIKQRRVAQDAVKQLDGKSAIWPAQLRFG